MRVIECLLSSLLLLPFNTNCEGDSVLVAASVESEQDRELTVQEESLVYDHSFDQETLNQTLNDDRTYVETTYTSMLGSVLPAVTGSISTVSSLLIIYIILISKKSLKTVYHRIMFVLSFYDIMASLAIAFSTLPMPKNMIYQQFEGLVLGNQASCTAQGFFFIFGANGIAAYSSALMLYYFGSLRLKWSESKIKRHMEPVLHFLSNLYAIYVGVSLLFTEAYNPTPLDSWCTAMTLPWWCPRERDEEGGTCHLRTKSGAYTTRLVMVVGSALIFVITIACLILVIHGVYRQEKMLGTYTRTMEGAGREDSRIGVLKKDFFFTKKITKEAGMYFFAFFSTNMFVILNLFTGKQEYTEEGFPMPKLTRGAMPIFHLTLRPLQGFFNLCIFIYHKYDSLRRAEPEIPSKEIFARIFCKGDAEESEFIISSLSIVKRERAAVQNGEVADQNDWGIVIVDDGGEVQSNSDPSTQVNLKDEALKKTTKYRTYGDVLRNYQSSVITEDHDTPIDSSGLDSTSQSESRSHATGDIYDLNTNGRSRRSHTHSMSEGFVEDNDISYADDSTFGAGSKFSFATFARSFKGDGKP